MQVSVTIKLFYKAPGVISLNFQAGGGFFKWMSVGPKYIYPLGAFVHVLPGKNLEMEMPVNAF